MTKDDLTPRERAVFDSLPREDEPSALLEERTVRALRDRDLLRRAHGSPNDRGLFLSGGLLAVAAAVVCAALIGAFTLGQSLGSGQTRESMLAMHEQDNAQEALSVQQAGAAYLAALVELTRASSATTPGARPAAETEAALASLYEVADQMVQLAPNDPLSVRILQAFDQIEVAAPGTNEDDQIIWF